MSASRLGSHPRTAAREVRRQAFLDAGWRLWATRGYHEITIEELCGAAGMAKGSFYLYFHDKADLLAALMRDEFARIDAEVDHIAQTYPDGLRRMQEFVALIDRATVDSARANVRADTQQLATQHAAFQELIVEISDWHARRIERWAAEAIASGEFADDLTARGIAQALLVLCTGVAVHRGNYIDDASWVTIGPVIERFLAGLRANPSE